MNFTHKTLQDDMIKAGTNTIQRSGIYRGKDNILHYFKQDKVEYYKKIKASCLIAYPNQPQNRC